MQELLLTLFLFESAALLPVRKEKKHEILPGIKNPGLLPADHVAGAHLEQDGDINKAYHHEAFLGKLFKEKKLDFSKKEGYLKLIEIYHKIDTNKDHLVQHGELEKWIYDRILEHYNAAKDESAKKFVEVDMNKDSFVTWEEYKIQLLGLSDAQIENMSASAMQDFEEKMHVEMQRWQKADHNHDKKLNRKEFLAFQHPEHNNRTLHIMAHEMILDLDKNKDDCVSLEEYIALPPGDVTNEEDAMLDKEYQMEKEGEFKNDMDTNGDNMLTREELLAYLDPRHRQHSSKEATYLIGISDRDKDGLLSENEMLLQYPLFTGSSFPNFAALLHDEM